MSDEALKDMMKMDNPKEPMLSRRDVLLGASAAALLFLAGCGNQSGDSLEITENGTYDVSGYSEVVVNVGDEQEPASIDSDAVEFVRVQFKGFSMEVPAPMVESYTEAELTENDVITLGYLSPVSGQYVSLNVTRYDYMGSSALENISDAPQQDVNGITMAIGHKHYGDLRSIDVNFFYEGILYSIDFGYPVSEDELFAEYAESFYCTIEMD